MSKSQSTSVRTLKHSEITTEWHVFVSQRRGFHRFPITSIVSQVFPACRLEKTIFILTLLLRLLWQISNYTVKATFKANLITFTEESQVAIGVI